MKQVKLLHRYHYDKSETHDKSDDGYSWSASETVSALDVYDYNGTPYIVSTDWYYEGSGDMADSDHYRSLSFLVYPVEPTDVEDEEKVRGIVADTKGYENRVSDYPNVNIRDEDSFTSSIRPHVIGAIQAYLANEKKKKAESCGEQPVPNVVKVYEKYAPEAEIIYDFDTDAGLGRVFYNCTSVGMEPLGEDSQKELGIERPLGYYYAVGRGKPRVYACRGFFDNCPTLGFRRSNWWDTGDSAVICAYESGVPGPLTPEEVQKILEYPTLDEGET